MKTIHRLTVSVLAAAAMLGTSACSQMSTQDKYMAGGAAAGAVAGAALTGGSTVGTVGGAALGGVIGNEVGKSK